MVVTLMGTGTSFGVPVIGCKCHVCLSKDLRDKRYRCSALVRSSEGVTVVIDVGAEFRLQALKYDITKLDAVLITHSHADHTHGMDDLRVFSHTKGELSNSELSQLRARVAAHRAAHPDQVSFSTSLDTGLKVYANSPTIQDLKSRFSYVFKPYSRGGGIPKFMLEDIGGYSLNSPLTIGQLKIVGVPLLHGDLMDSGYLIKEGDASFLYLTDCSKIEEDSYKLIEASGPVSVAVIDALRPERHSTHFSFDEAHEAAIRIGARQTFITHICHDTSYEEILSYIRNKWGDEEKFSSAYDGLTINI